MTIPKFKFSVSNPNDKKFGFITHGHEKVFPIPDIEEFYATLGYTDAIKHSGLLADEFVWFEYRKDQSAKTEACLQARIIEYLSKHWTSFVEEYAAQLDKWVGCCPEAKVREDMVCGNCPLHPGQKTTALADMHRIRP